MNTRTNIQDTFRIFGPAESPFTVLCENGLGATQDYWIYIRKELEETTEVLTYDRPTLTEPNLFEENAHKLKQRLGKLSIGKPLVFCAHSLGGIFAMSFAKLFPDAVAGLCLLDPVHPDLLREDPALRKFFRRYFLYLRMAKRLPEAVLKSAQGFGTFGQAEGLPLLERSAWKAALSDQAHLNRSSLEADAWQKVEMSGLEKVLQQGPSLVISAGTWTEPTWKDYQQRLGLAATRSLFLETTHLGLLTTADHAKKVASEIRDFLADLNRSKPSPPRS